MRVNIVPKILKPEESEKTWSERLLGEINSNTTITKFAKQQLSTVVKGSDDLADAITKVENAYKKAKEASESLKKSTFANTKERKEAI